MKTITHTPTEREGITRKLALTSLLFLPFHFIPAALVTLELDLALFLFLSFIILNVALAMVAWFTRNRTHALAAILMPFATILLTILYILLFSFGDGMRLY